MLERGVDLSRWSSFGTPSIAEWAATVRTVPELERALAECRGLSLPTTVLRGGTNVLLRSRVPGCVIRAGIRGISTIEGKEHVDVTAGSGESWHELVRWSIGRGLSGIENLALIPGTVGAAPIQNIGAYGVELSETLRMVRAVDRGTGESLSIEAAACELAYRDSVFKTRLSNRLVITAIVLRLSRTFRPVLGYPDVARELVRMGSRTTSAAVAEAVIRVRRRKLPSPRAIGNAGSFFKNPVIGAALLGQLRAALPSLPARDAGAGNARVPAAALIDACGFKGRQRGRVGVWHRQPLVLVNRGGATANEILDLADEIRVTVINHFGVALELEPSVIGEDGPSP